MGRFGTSEEAALAYDACLRHHGVGDGLLRRLNFPTPQEVGLLSGAAQRRAENAQRNQKTEALSKHLFEQHLDHNDWELEWMYEGTRADGALKKRTCSIDDGWVGIQIKATNRPTQGIRRVYQFAGVSGYDGLLVICIALDQALLWTIPGGDLKVRTLTITIGGKWDTDVVGAH